MLGNLQKVQSVLTFILYRYIKVFQGIFLYHSQEPHGSMNSGLVCDSRLGSRGLNHSRWLHAAPKGRAVGSPHPAQLPLFLPPPLLDPPEWPRGVPPGLAAFWGETVRAHGSPLSGFATDESVHTPRCAGRHPRCLWPDTVMKGPRGNPLGNRRRSLYVLLSIVLYVFSFLSAWK